MDKESLSIGVLRNIRFSKIQATVADSRDQRSLFGTDALPPQTGMLVKRAVA